MKIMMYAMRKTFRAMMKWKKSLFIMIFFMWVSGVLTPFLQVLMPSFLLYLIETESSIIMLLWFALLFGLVTAFLDSVSTYLTQLYDPKMYIVKCKLTLALYDKAMNTPYAQMEDMGYRQKLNRAQKNGIESNNVGFECFIRNLIFLSIALTGFILYAAVFGSIQIWLCFVVVLLSIFSIFLISRAQAYEHQKKSEYAIADQQLQYYHHNVKLPKNGKDIRIFHMQDYLIHRIKKYQIKRIRTLSDVERKYLYAKLGTTLLSTIRTLLVFGYFIYQLMHGMSISAFVFYTSAATAFSGWINQIVSYYNETKRGALGIIDYEDFMNEVIQDDEQCMSLPQDDLEICFDHVYFCYPGAKKDTLKDVSFTVHKKEKIGLVGSNGAGKTTLMKLLCGLYTPTKGHIYINGIDIRYIKKEDLYSHIAAIFQDSSVMAYSFKKNVACLPKKQIQIDKVFACLEKCGLKDKVEACLQKENTYVSNIISEEGTMLSGGEQQKLMMARALYKEAKILVLDEPSAALDALAEASLYETYEQAAKECTSIFISHRLASTRFANRILLFDDGILKEEGRHEELLQKDGLYKKMFGAQASYYQKEEKEDERTY